MPNQPVADLLTAALPNLNHPGVNGGPPIPIVLPTFRNSGIPQEQAEQFAREAGLPHADLARLTAEALVHTVESSGRTIIDNAELTDLRRAAAVREPQRHTQQELHCTNCDTRLFRAAIVDFNTDKPKISPNVIRALQGLSPECATGHRT
jgi:hypothetical protein